MLDPKISEFMDGWGPIKPHPFTANGETFTVYCGGCGKRTWSNDVSVHPELVWKFFCQDCATAQTLEQFKNQ